MTVQNLYTQYLDGKITKQKFLYEVRRDQNLDMISSSNSFDDVVKILKNKSIISEKAHKEAKLATGKQEVDIIAKTIDMVNPYEYSRGMDYELDIMDVPATSGDLSKDNVLKAQKKVLANLTKNPQYYCDKIHGKGEVTEEWVEATKKEIDKIGKGKPKTIREGYEPNQTVTFTNKNSGKDYTATIVKDLGDGKFTFKASQDGKIYNNDSLGSNWIIKTNEVFEGGFVSRGAILKALEDVGSESEIRQYLTSLEKSGDKFENVDDYVEDFRNYVADKSLEEGQLTSDIIKKKYNEMYGRNPSTTFADVAKALNTSESEITMTMMGMPSLEEHGKEYDRIADVNADSSPLEERQKAIYEKYAEKTGIPMENLMSMVREAKAKIKEDTFLGKDAIDDLKKHQKFGTLSSDGKKDAEDELKKGGSVTIG
jgi:hypothetical protein